MQTEHAPIQEKKRIPFSKVVRSHRWIHWTLMALIVLGIAAGGYEIYNLNQAQKASAAEPALQTAVARVGDITLEASGSGTLIADQEVSLAFKTSGVLTKLNVAVGDQVKAGEVLAQLDDSTQATALAQAKQALLELTSPAAIATAQEAVATDEQTVYNDQAALNNLIYQNTNKAAIQNAKSNLVLASNNLAHWQKIYSQIPGDPSTDADKANAYQLLYSAQLAYQSVEATYNLTAGKANQMLVDKDTAALALAKATLAEDQTLVEALTGGTVPANATGSGYDTLQQAKLAVQTAQENQDNTTLTSSISGTVLSISNSVGDTVGSGSTFVTIADLSQAEIQIYMDESDWSNVKVGYVADVSFDSLPNQTFTGKLTQVSPSLISSSGNSVVEGLVELDASQGSDASNPIETLPLGVSASVDVISAQAKNVVIVPIQALHQLSSSSYGVFVLKNGTPTLKVVAVGLQSDTFAEIKSGLQAGDVVTTGIQATSKSTTSN